MAAHDVENRFAYDPRNPEDRALVTSGLWLRAGFVALSVEAIALIMLATGEAAPWIAIAFAVVAGVIARWSWARARTALDIEGAKTSAADLAAATKPHEGVFPGRAGDALPR
jgi:hypothetical protein